jgi:hypothetical protein
MVRVIKRAPAGMVLEDQLKPEPQIKVRVIDRWRVVHDGKPYVKGDEVTVPEDVAKEWERNGYVDRVSGKAD